MRRSRFSETQIVGILKEADSGVAVKDVCRKHGISDATYYQWKSKYGGLEVSDVRRMRERVVRVLEQVAAWRGLPQAIRFDNGPEFMSHAFVQWCQQKGIAIRYIQPGKPNQNAFVERFNKTYRDEILDSYLFEDLEQVREISYQWQIKYNERRPHDALGSLPPTVFREQQTAGNSTYEWST